MATYYVANAGSDTLNTGTSIGSPWQTIAKINATTLLPGDAVRFNRGDIWNERLNPGQSGSAGNYITFTAYGSGALPIFVAASGRAECITFVAGRDYLRASFLQLEGGDAASASALFECDGGTHSVIEDCLVDGQLTLADSCIAVGGSAFLTVNRCTMKRARDDGFTMHTTASALLTDCLITLNSQGINNSGSAMSLTVVTSTIRDNINQDIADLSGCTSLFDRCDIGRRATPGSWKVFDGSNGTTTFRYCRLDFTGGNSTSTPEFNTLALTVLENCTVVGNNTGKFGVSNAPLNATNTIFSGINKLCNLFTGGTFNKDHCLTYNVTSGSVTSNTSPITPADPLFVSSTDFRIQSGSPANNAGTNLGLTLDMSGRTVSNPPDIGAYEYVSGGTISAVNITVGALVLP